MPSEGLCRIGVKYLNEYQAIKSYEEVLSGQEENSYSLMIEFVMEKLNLSLVSDATGKKTYYKNVSYSIEQMKKIIIGVDQSRKFQFLHTYSKSNVLTIAKPFNSQFFISLSKIEIIEPINI